MTTDLKTAINFHKKNMLLDAQSIYLNLLSINPKNFDALHLYGITLFQQSKYLESIKVIRKSLKINSESSSAWSNLGNSFRALKRFITAKNCYKKSIQLNNQFTEGIVNLANILCDLNQNETAVKYYETALMQKQNAAILTNYANCLRSIKRFPEALNYYKKAVMLDSTYKDAIWNEAWCLLLLGNYQDGFVKYEARPANNSPAKFYIPRWNFENLNNKKILITTEQGLGDNIQFSRYIKGLKEMGAIVVLETDLTLLNLFKSNNIADELFIKNKANSIIADYSYPIASLPFAFKTTLESIPSEIPYLKPSTKAINKWSQILHPNKEYIGVTWSGNPNFQNDFLRSIPIEYFGSLFKCNHNFIVLKNNLSEHDERFIRNFSNVFFWGELIDDMEDTSAIIHLCKMVISTCTSIAHLAGAQGKKTYVLLSYDADWRWLENTQTSPWYQASTLIRQGPNKNWREVIENLVLAIS
jgi:tetratricopeptide (TPR) repeat protein